MSDGVLFSKAAVKRVVAGLAAVAAVAMTVESTIGNLPEQLDLRGAIPQNLQPDEYVVGVPWTGEPGRVVTVAELEAATAREPKVAGPIERRREQSGASEHLIKTSNPEAPAVAQWPFAGPSPVVRDHGGPAAAFTISTGINGPSFGGGETNAVPPDSNGAVGPNHVMIVANGRFKIFTKTGTQLASFSDSVFWLPVTGSGVSDPHIRYDRTSGRWFITEIDVANTSNKILVAVSSGSDISAASSFTVYGFNHDSPDGGGIDAGHFADYDTLGVDANALYPVSYTHLTLPTILRV